MFLYPFKRIVFLLLGHSVSPIKESFLRVHLHQAGDMYLRLILKRAHNELPILPLGKVDHQLVYKVGLTR